MMPGYQASDSENAYDFFFRFFFFSIRPTDPISGNAFDGKQKKRGGWPNLKRLGKMILRLNRIEHFIYTELNATASTFKT